MLTGLQGLSLNASHRIGLDVDYDRRRVESSNEQAEKVERAKHRSDEHEPRPFVEKQHWRA